MLGNSAFYHKTIRGVTAAFGSLFNDISIVRSKGAKTQTVKVPLSYASADKAFERRKVDPTLNYNMQGVFPRMSFYMTGMSYDPLRKVTASQLVSKDNQFLFSPAPYNLEFDLYLATANIEDGLQIIEQILPFFNPEFTLSTNALPSLNLKYDVPIVLNSVSYNDPGLDSDFTDFRIIEWTLTFVAKTYILGPVKTRNEIKHTNINIFDQLPFSEDFNFEDVNSDVVPDTAKETDPHSITTTVIQKS